MNQQSKVMAIFMCCLQMGFDVFNALDLMDNNDFLLKLKFGVGDGFLQYYLYNWKCPHMDTNQVRESSFVCLLNRVVCDTCKQ